MTRQSNPVSQAQAARMKVIDPLVSAGPATHVQVLEWGSELYVRVPCAVFVGALVHVRMATRIVVGEVRQCVRTDSGYEIRANVRESIALA
jgi:hypothetical protein